MACLTADIANTTFPECFGEKMVNIQDRGAVAYYGSAAVIGINNTHTTILTDILDNFDYRLGDAILYAELICGQLDDSMMQTLIGDPALRAFGYRYDPGLPDLTLASTSMDYDPEAEQFDLSVSNLGGVDAENVSCSVYLYEADGTESLWTDQIFFSNVPANLSVSTSISLAPILPGGYYSCIVKIDPENNITESFELNNGNGRVINTCHRSTIICQEGGSHGSLLEGITVEAYDMMDNMLAQETTDRFGEAHFYITEQIDVVVRAYHNDVLAAESEPLSTPVAGETLYLQESLVTVLQGIGGVQGAEVKVFYNSEYQGRGVTDSLGQAKFYIAEGLRVSLEIWNQGALAERMLTSIQAPFNQQFFLPNQSVVRLSDPEFFTGVQGAKISAYDPNGYLFADEVVTDSNGFVNLYLEEGISLRFEAWYEPGGIYTSECLAAVLPYQSTPCNVDLYLPNPSKCSYYGIDGLESYEMPVEVLNASGRIIGTGESGANFFIRPGTTKFRVLVDEDDYRFSEDFAAPQNMSVYPYVLVIDSQHGDVQINPEFKSYPVGTHVTILAHSDFGYTFENWSGDIDCLVGPYDSNPVSLIMDGFDTKKEITANYKKVIKPYGPTFGAWEPRGEKPSSEYLLKR